ncbi:dual OB domain-containing protein [Streptomyces rimosus]|uniref:dual OB domain-containing protein n=1 Tax=Streptomyces rimosus TaxID=1927 RepID=UPI00373FD0E2
MPEYVTLICLANSRKKKGRCVAGMIAGSGKWIRPVSARPGHAISVEEQRYADRSVPRVPDIMTVPLLRPQPISYQSENWLLDPGYRWHRTGTAGWSQLLTMEQRPDTLWINGCSSFNRYNDRVPIALAATLPDSLKLIRVNRMTLKVHTPDISHRDAKRAVDVRFTHGGHMYIMRVTDPKYEQAYLSKPERRYELGEAFLTVSLSEEYLGHAYKLVASIIERANITAGSKQ